MTSRCSDILARRGVLAFAMAKTVVSGLPILKNGRRPQYILFARVSTPLQIQLLSSQCNIICIVFILQDPLNVPT